MLALCSMLLVTYYAFNYAGIIGLGLASLQKFTMYELAKDGGIELRKNPEATCSLIGPIGVAENKASFWIIFFISCVTCTGCSDFQVSSKYWSNSSQSYENYICTFTYSLHDTYGYIASYITKYTYAFDKTVWMLAIYLLQLLHDYWLMADSSLGQC